MIKIEIKNIDEIIKKEKGSLVSIGAKLLDSIGVINKASEVEKAIAEEIEISLKSKLIDVDISFE